MLPGRSSVGGLVLRLVVGGATVACGSEGQPIGGGVPDARSPDPNGSGTGVGSELADGGTDAGIGVGTCTFALGQGRSNQTWTGAARARMNGAGNLRVQCTGRTNGSADETTLELGFGNGTLDGPRKYLADDFSSDGSVRYEMPERVYWSNVKGSSCVLVLTEAPVDGLTRTVPKGARIAATFACDALVADGDEEAPPITIGAGSIAAVVE